MYKEKTPPTKSKTPHLVARTGLVRKRKIDSLINKPLAIYTEQFVLKIQLALLLTILYIYVKFIKKKLNYETHDTHIPCHRPMHP